ncbi:hypothetical protein PoB_003406100 [Plakobranchus ocellatus]|uniref:Uncharacterized protein n=1 Tax=Plakobranchus ocellatus TaxID=259542 RepID=A0AAV4A8K7_9GAST|nr:hypothetical protein PoB_003406100 [Plakobranchus ocellatus]
MSEQKMTTCSGGYHLSTNILGGWRGLTNDLSQMLLFLWKRMLQWLLRLVLLSGKAVGANEDAAKTLKCGYFSRSFEVGWLLHIASPQQGNPRLLGPPSGQDAGSGARTRVRKVPADGRADSLTTVPVTPRSFEQTGKMIGGCKTLRAAEESHGWTPETDAEMMDATLPADTRFR